MLNEVFLFLIRNNDIEKIILKKFLFNVIRIMLEFRNNSVIKIKIDIEVVFLCCIK